MKKILILISYYFPGTRSGGPQQTIKNLVDMFSHVAEFYIYTQNHDLGIKEEYQGIEFNKWIKRGNSNVMYVSSDEYYKKLAELYREFKIIYSCGLFERCSIMALYNHKKFYAHDLEKKLYIAPMGVFSKGAIRSKYLKKYFFLRVFSALGMFKHVIWSFSSTAELNDALNYLNPHNLSNYIIAEDLPCKVDFQQQLQRLENSNLSDGKRMKIIFLGRICHTKNLEYSIDILKNIYKKDLIFDIYGPIEEQTYWKKCKRKLECLPPNIKYRYCGAVEPNNVITIFSQYDIFLFPTKGENYGHVIYEAMSAGCIPIISDTTPWRDLEKENCGFICALDDIESFQRVLIQLISIDMYRLTKLKKNAILYAEKKYTNSLTDSGYFTLINE